MSSLLVFNRVYRPEIQPIILVFSTSLVNCCASPSLWPTPLNTLFLTRFITYKIATSPQTKTPVKTTFRDWCLYSSFVHAPGVEGWGILGCKWNCVGHDRAILKKGSSKTTCPVPFLWFSLVRILRRSSLKNSFVCLSSPTIYIFIFYPPRSHRGHIYVKSCMLRITWNVETRNNRH
jgi:hypothetical protein